MSDPWAEFNPRPAPADPWAEFNPRPAEGDDPYRRTARAEMTSDRAKGVPANDGIGRQVLQGLTLGGADEVLAGLNTIPQMIKRGTFNPVEGYRHAKAREDVELEDARARGGGAGTAAEVGGSVLTGSGLARGGLTLFRPGMSYVNRIGAATAEGLGYGAVQGGLDARDGERTKGALEGATVGAGVGTGVTAAAPLVKGVLSPITSAVSSRLWPQAATDRQVGRTIMETGRTPADIEGGMRAAEIDNQGGAYTLADELGHPGQRMLSTIARTPGEGRTRVVTALDRRQAGQSRRLANVLDEGFATGGHTAERTRDDLEAARRAISNQNYSDARASAGTVNTGPAVQAADNFLQPGASGVMQPQSGIADDSVEAAVRRARGYLTDGRSLVSEFSTAQRAKVELDAMIERSSPTIQRQLIPIRNALDDQLAAASPPYANARDTHRAMSGAVDAVETGQTVGSGRGRVEDNIQTFRGLNSRAAQQAFRQGYVDPQIARMQNQSVRANKTIPLTDEAFEREAAEFAAPGQGPVMARRLGREGTMAETYEGARTGSRTADNLADEAALAVDPDIAINAATGNAGGLIRSTIRRIAAHSKGLTPEVRDRVAAILLQTAQSPTPQTIGAVIRRVVGAETTAQRLGSALTRGTAAGAVNANR